MKKIVLILLSLNFCQSFAQTTITIMDSVVFYDGYAGVVTTPLPPAGITRHRNDLHARKLTAAEVLSIGSTLQLNVVISALCDNYDRIGSVNIALVPSGASSYHPDSVEHIEIARFITPFMNKNYIPKSVPYTYNIDNIALLLKDSDISSIYDFWIELSVFGVPYAANTEVAGCSNRNDVFQGKLEFVTNGTALSENTNVLINLAFNDLLNNYQLSGTDTLGLTTRTINFTVTENLNDAALFLITSNHGANSGGEEYNRRFHYTYFDDEPKLTYKPGRLTCEPFRVYNTQGNGIYGPTPRTPAQWQSFSNWCPGDVIDIRRIDLGAVTAGNHSFKIRIPTAQFVGGQGNIPMSLYFQGKTTGNLPVGINETNGYSNFVIYPNPNSGKFTVETFSETVLEVIVTDLLGKQVLTMKNLENKFDLIIENKGIFIVTVKTSEGTKNQKIIIE